MRAAPPRSLSAALRSIHPAPAFAVIALSAALAAILAAQAGSADPARIALTVLAVAGSQVATGATNDWADRDRDRLARPEKPIPAGDLGPRGALTVAAAGVALQLAASVPLGAVAGLLGLAALASALTYNLGLSRTPLSVVPYLVSFSLLPAWVASGVEVPIERVVPALPLIVPFVAAAHLANTLRDWDADAAGGSRSLAQVLGRRASRRLALGLALAVGAAVPVELIVSGGLTPAGAGLGVIGLAAILNGARGDRALWYGILVAAVCWTAAWALSSA